jgi:hypothetical protein
VFLSYASEDRALAQLLRDALPTQGLDVWFDESELTGGDQWDQMIRKQIRECDFFMPLISATTAARHEGYFRREWRLAVERSLDMADDHLFLAPIAIDETSAAEARVPEKFLTVQWTRVPGGQPNSAFEALCRRLLVGDVPPTPREAARHHPPSYPPLGSLPEEPRRRRRERERERDAVALRRELPDFPREEPGQQGRFWFEVVAWAAQSTWVVFRRFPRAVQWLVYLWLFGVLVSQCQSSGRHDASISDSDAKKLREIAKNYEGSANKTDIAKLGTQIANAFADDDNKASGQDPVLAIPFSAPAEDPAARQFVDATFAQLFGRIAISHHGHVGLLAEPLAAPDPGLAAQRGREHHSKYVLFGAVDESATPHRLTVKMLSVEDATVRWSGSYPTDGADPAAIATEVDSRVHELEDED